MANCLTWLVHITCTDRYGDEEDDVLNYPGEKSALEYLTDVATGERENVKINRVYEVNVVTGTIRELKPELDGFRLRLIYKS